MLGLAQVIGPLLVAETEGLQVSTTAEQLLEAVQPLDCVTVTVYWLPFDTEMFAVVAPLLQL